MKITKIETVKEETSRNSLELNEKHYTRRISGVIQNGSDKGEEKDILYEETYSSVVTDRFRVGDKVFVDGTELELKRDFYFALIVCVFIVLIYMVGSYKGLLSAASVVINSAVFYIGLNLYINGVDLLFLCVVEMLLFSVLSLMFASGLNKKTLSAVVSVMISAFVMLALLLVVVKTTDKIRKT